MAALLLANKADANARAIQGYTPLHTAAGTGYKELAVLLLANKADVNARDYRDRTPLVYAGRGGYKEIVELLRQHGGRE